MNKQRLNRKVKPVNNFANRGMSFESAIERTNKYYKRNNIALVRKIPTPIRVTKFDDKGQIIGAFYEKKSALDFNGIADGYHIDFDTKETKSKTSFAFSLIQEHQFKYAVEVSLYGGISFFLVRFYEHDEVYVLTMFQLSKYKELFPDKKSIPYSYFKEELKSFFVKREMKNNFIVYDYINVLENNNIL